jgi:hypothetical protein
VIFHLMSVFPQLAHTFVEKAFRVRLASAEWLVGNVFRLSVGATVA